MELSVRVVLDAWGAISLHGPEAVGSDFRHFNDGVVAAVAGGLGVLTDEDVGDADLGLVLVGHSEILLATGDGKADEHANGSVRAVGDVAAVERVSVVEVNKVGEAELGIVDGQRGAARERILPSAVSGSLRTALVDAGERELGDTVRRVDEVVVVKSVAGDVSHPHIRAASDVVREGSDRGVDLLGDEAGLKREGRVCVKVSRDCAAVGDIDEDSVVCRVVAGVGVERRGDAFSSGVVSVGDCSTAGGLVVGCDGGGSPLVAHLIRVRHRPVHLTVGKVLTSSVVIHGGIPLGELDLPHAVGVSVDVGDGINADVALAERARWSGVAGVAHTALRVGKIPSKVIGVRVLSADAHAVAVAVVRAGLTGATCSLKSREALALAGGSVAGALVGALAVEVAFIPLRSVVVTGQTVPRVVLLADGAVGVVEVHLLVSVDGLVGVDVAQRRVNEGLAKVAQALGAVVSGKPALTLAGGPGVAHTVLVAVVVAASRDLSHDGAEGGDAEGVHLGSKRNEKKNKRRSRAQTVSTKAAHGSRQVFPQKAKLALTDKAPQRLHALEEVLLHLTPAAHTQPTRAWIHSLSHDAVRNPLRD